MSVNPWSGMGSSPSLPGGGSKAADRSGFSTQRPVSDPTMKASMKLMKATGLPGKVGRPNNSIKSMTRMMTKSNRRSSLMKGY